jgi:protein-S-isoprenylcysteine O-methyltransferase Ste14
MNYFVQLTKRKYSLAKRLIASLAAGILFAGLIPFVLIYLLPRVDVFLQLPRFYLGIGGYIIGGLCIVIGGIFTFWSIGDQVFKAQGTPIPFIATQVLLITGPFRLCRNPMVFGAILVYSGISILINSVSSLIFSSLFAIMLIVYIKLFEEEELEARFGEAYRVYKTSTPFIIPKLFSSDKK